MLYYYYYTTHMHSQRRERERECGGAFGDGCAVDSAGSGRAASAEQSIVRAFARLSLSLLYVCITSLTNASEGFIRGLRLSPPFAHGVQSLALARDRTHRHTHGTPARTGTL